MAILQHAPSRRSEDHSRSDGTTATPIHSLYTSPSPLTSPLMRSQQSSASAPRRAPSPPLRHHSTSTSSLANASAAESFTSYSHKPGHSRQPPPGIPPQLVGNYLAASLRDPPVFRPYMPDGVHNAPGAPPLRPPRKNTSAAPGVTPADALHASSTAAGQVQRVDVKRLMSKPTAVPLPSSKPSHSKLSVLTHGGGRKTHARANPSSSDGETADRETSVHPLKLRQPKRSRTADDLILTTSMSVPIRPPVTPTTSSTTTLTHSNTLQPYQVTGLSFTTGETTTMALKSPIMPNTVRPKEVISTRVASSDCHTTVRLDTPSHKTVLSARHAASLDLTRTGNLTPASAVALAWNESQRQQLQPSPDPSSSQLRPPPRGNTLPFPLSKDNTSEVDTWSYRSYGHAALGSVSDLSMRGEHTVAVGGPDEGAEDPYRMWAMVEEKLRQTTHTPSGGNPIKELRRRVTGRFSRGKDKNKERERKMSESISAFYPPSVHPAASGMPQRQTAEQGIDRQPAADLVVPELRGSSLIAPPWIMSRKSWGEMTNASNPSAVESYNAQVTPTGSAMDVNYSDHIYSPPPSAPGSESQMPAASTRMQSKSPAPSRWAAEPAEGDTGKLWRLVRKLSHGGLRKERQRFANELGDSLASAADVPPVPALPKDFELVDHRAYIAEHDSGLAPETASWVGRQPEASLEPVEEPGSSGTQSTFTMQSPPVPSSRTERSPIPVLPTTSPPSTLSVSPPHFSIAQHIMANTNALGSHPHPPKGKHIIKTPAHRPTASQQSTMTSVHEFSSASVVSDMTNSKVMTSPYSRRSSVSSNSELNTTAVAIARPIIPPDELFRIPEAQSAVGQSGAPSGRVQPRGPRNHIKRNNKGSVGNNSTLVSPASPPPPSSSPAVRQHLLYPVT
jgi:hypothetical protein